MTFVMNGEQEEADGVELPSEDEIEAALSIIPEDVNWDWAFSRLIPLFERSYAEGIAGDPMVNTVSPVGIGIGFGIDFGPCSGE